MADSERRRRRLRHHPGRGPGSDETATDGPSTQTGTDGPSTQTGTDGPSTQTTRVYDPTPVPTGPRRRFEPPGPAEERDGERGLRGLLGSGSSQVSIGAALRARDAARPTEADLAEAERRLVVVRRNWVPREDLPRPERR